jgi:hypothetical protein
MGVKLPLPLAETVGVFYHRRETRYKAWAAGSNKYWLDKHEVYKLIETVKWKRLGQDPRLRFELEKLIANKIRCDNKVSKNSSDILP